MTVDELIEALESIRDAKEGNGDREVHIGTQPNYPLESRLDGVCDPDENNGKIRRAVAEFAAKASPEESEDAREERCDDLCEKYGIEDADELWDAVDGKESEPKAIVLLEGKQIGYGSKTWWEGV